MSLFRHRLSYLLLWIQTHFLIKSVAVTVSLICSPTYTSTCFPIKRANHVKKYNCCFLSKLYLIIFLVAKKFQIITYLLAILILFSSFLHGRNVECSEESKWWLSMSFFWDPIRKIIILVQVVFYTFVSSKW